MTDADSRRWLTLTLVALAELLGMSLWFTASAVGPHLAARWDLEGGQTAALTTMVQVGFVAGTAVATLLNLADLLPAKWLFAGSALAGAVANGLLVAAPEYGTALALRFLTGFFLAGVYPPAMKMIATWFRAARGLAIGIVVGALTVGKATPYLIRFVEQTDFRWVVLVASAGAVGAAGLVVAGYREGPFPFPRRAFSWGLAVTVLRHRPTRLAIAGYLGHMWELYAMWTWVPAFLAASLAAKGGVRASVADLAAFGAIAAGGLGCLWGGWAADRIGRERLVNRAMAVSGLCSLGVGLLYGGPFWLVALVTWVWGFFVVADSAQFSALVTEVAPPHAVGTALTLQTSLGFLLTAITIHLVPVLITAAGWPWAFPVLALGPGAGIVAIVRLARGEENRQGRPRRSAPTTLRRPSSLLRDRALRERSAADRDTAWPPPASFPK